MLLNLTACHSRYMIHGPMNGISVNILARKKKMRNRSTRTDLTDTMTLETIRQVMKLI